MIRSNSIQSYTSDQLEEEDRSQDVEFDLAPWDILGAHESLGDSQIIVAKKGDKLPLETKYKRKGSGPPVKFQVSRSLEVTPMVKPSRAEEAIRNADIVISDDVNLVHENVLGDVTDAEIVQNATTSNDQRMTSSADNSRNNPNVAVLSVANESARRDSFMSETEFLVKLSNSFSDVVIGGLDSSVRSSVADKFVSGLKLSSKENNSVINSLNQAVSEQIGCEKRPNAKLCDKLAEILKCKFPSTYRVLNTVQTAFGTLELKRSRGEGGNSELSKRIGNCFYNQFVRPNKKKPAQEVGDSNDCVVIRKRKIFNGVNAEKFNIYETSSKNEKDSSLKSYNELEACDLFEEKKAYLHDARIHIQYCFQRYEPSQAVEKLKGFWDGGIGLLSDWFEWIVDGSKYGDLSKASLEMLPKVLNIVEQFILSKRGEVYEAELNRSKRHALASNGNDIMYQVFLIRDLAKLFKNRGEKLIFIDGEDVEIIDENYPNIFLRKENVMGEATFREKVVFHLRIGNDMVIENVSLCEALAGIVQLFYSFYLHYPSEADELFNVVQRFICNYTTKDDTVNNKKGALKKSFKDFEVKLHNFTGYMTNFW